MKLIVNRRRRITGLLVGYLAIDGGDAFTSPSLSNGFPFVGINQRERRHPLFSAPGDEIIMTSYAPPVLKEEGIIVERKQTAQTEADRRRLRRTIIARRRQKQNELEDESRSREDYIFLLVAFVPCILAYTFWQDISLGLATYIDEHGAVGRAVDGNAFANSLIRPTITGVVVPMISIALATLLSSTVNILRDRQVQIRSLINKEACDLRLLRRAIFGMFGTRQHAGRRSRALGLMTSYVEQLDKESQKGAIEILEEMEISGGIAANELDRLSSMLHGVDGAAASRQGSVGVADDAMARLNEYRSDRIALLLTDFPDLHWVVLFALSVSICIMFLLESNQALNQYLNSIQLQALFALLVGVFSALATLCLDLVDPFTGSFSIVSASAQIGDLRLCLQEDIREADAEENEVHSRSFGQLFQPSANSGNKSGTTSTRYSLWSTIYFHLLTGPFGSNVRAFGEAVAWVATGITKQIRNMLRWRKRWTHKR